MRPMANDAPHQQPPTEPLISLRDVGKAFPGGTTALERFSLSVAAGEFVSLLGPSGCGKSTVLRLVAGLALPTSGEVMSPQGKTPDSSVGCVFQEPTLLPWSRVWENVFLPLRIQGVSRSQAQDRVDSAIQRVGLAGFERAYPRELSGGMKMRVSVARAIVAQPKLLMLDEPFAALDEITRFRLNDDLQSLWRDQGWTGLFVTHSVYESVFLSSRVVVMTGRPGRVHEAFPIELPYPRTEATRADPTYVALCQRVSASLRSAEEVRHV